MKKSALAVIVALLGVSFGGFTRHIFAAGLETKIYSDNHSYSTVDENQVSTLRIAMKPSASAPDSAIEIYLYAIAPDDTATDGRADYNAFDIANITVECPASIPGVFEFGPPQITPAAQAYLELSDGYYHRIVCPYTGTGDVDRADFGYSNTNYLTIRGLINPRNNPALDETQLIYSPIWVHFSSAVAQMTLTSGRQVEMLASVSPQISLVLEGVATDEAHCGTTNAHPTTGAKASFGAVSNNAFIDIVQKLTASTNMVNGYVLTAIQDDQMRRTDAPNTICLGDGVGNAACVPDSQAPGISPLDAVDWGDPNSHRGLGFTLENDFGYDTIFDYTDGYRTFADQQNEDEPVPILQSNNGHLGIDYVCYRVVADEENQPGYYVNNITYTLTAKF